MTTSNTPRRRLAVRIGVHLGDVVMRNGDLFGDSINVAARLQPLAKPGGVCISSAVYQAVLKSVEPKPILVGEVELKNILERHVVYEFPPLYDPPGVDIAGSSAATRQHSFGTRISRVDDLPPPISKRYLFHDIRGIDEWLEWTVTMIGPSIFVERLTRTVQATWSPVPASSASGP